MWGNVRAGMAADVENALPTSLYSILFSAVFSHPHLSGTHIFDSPTLLHMSSHLGIAFPVLLDFATASQPGSPPSSDAKSASTSCEGWTPEAISSNVSDIAHEVLAGESVDEDTPLMDAGFDSLSAIAFRTTLCKAIGGPRIPGTLLFDYPTIRQISAYLASTHLAQQGASSNAHEPSVFVGSTQVLN
jgi:acyl carrier protein